MPEPKFDSREVRQGNQSPRILYVLIAGIVLALGAMTIVNLWPG